MKEKQKQYQIGDWVHPMPAHNHTQRALRVLSLAYECLIVDVKAELDKDDIAPTTWHKSNVRPATQEEIDTVPVKAGDWVTTTKNGTVYELFKEFAQNGNWIHATPEEYRIVLASWRGVPFNAIGETDRVCKIEAKVKNKVAIKVPFVEDKQLEDSRDDLCNEIDVVKLEATLGDHENRLKALNQNALSDFDAHVKEIRSIDSRLADLENKPSNPCGERDLAIIYRCRLGKNGRWIRTRGDYVDKLGRGEYTGGTVIGTGKNREQPTVKLYPEALEPMPNEPEPCAFTIRRKALEEGRLAGIYEKKDDYKQGMYKGIKITSIGYAITTMVFSLAYYLTYIL